MITQIPSEYKRNNSAALRSASCRHIMLLALMLMFSSISALQLAAHPAFNIRRGLSALQSGDLEQAETELQRARFAEPDNPVVSYNLGVVSYRRRDYQKAAGFFMQSASTAGNDATMRFDSLYNLGNAAFKAGDYASAVSAYSGSIEVKADEKASYNLEVARKKLQEQQEQQKEQEQQQQQKDQQQDKNSQPKDQQNQDQKGQQDKNDQKSGDQSGQQGDQPQSQENKPSPQDPQNQQGEDKQNSDSESGKDEQKSGDQKPGEESDQQKAEKPASGEDSQNASQTQQLNEQTAADPSENREDIEMGGDDTQQTEPQKPDASQRARALKNVRLNPYQVERLLQQMQERERQAQLYYRNEPQRVDEEDPFNMNAQQLHEWFENRGRNRPRPKTDEPDW